MDQTPSKPEVPIPEGAPRPPAVDAERRVRALVLKIGGRILQVLIPVGVLAILWHQARSINFRQVQHTFEEADLSLAGWAVVAAVCALCGMGGYDWISFPTTPKLSAPKRFGLGVILFAWTNLLGLGPLGGPALRLYFYKRAGMSMGQIGRGLLRLYLAFGAGLSSWLIASIVPVHGILARLGIALVLAPTFAVVATEVVARVRRFTPEERTPVWRSVVLGVLGVVDWGAALACFAFTAKAIGNHLAPEVCARVLYTGHAAGIVSMLPGGLGSADAVWLKLLGLQSVSPEKAAAQVLLFRLCFYIVPWLLSLVALYVLFSAQSAAAARWLRRLLAFAAGLNAVYLLASTATPTLRARLEHLEDIVPLPVVEVSHAVSVLTSLAMLLLIRGLLKGYRAAFISVGFCLFTSMFAHLFKGGDYEEAIVCAGLLVLLLGARKSFDRKGSIPLGWELAAAIAMSALLFFTLIGLASFNSTEYRPTMWTRVAYRAEASRTMRTGALLAGFGLVVLLRQAMRPREPDELGLAGPEEIDRALGLARAKGARASSLTIACADKDVWFFETEGAPAYKPGRPDPAKGMALVRRHRGKLVVFGDPVCERGFESDLLAELQQNAADQDLGLVFYQVSADWLAHLHDFNYGFFKLGEEAIVTLAEFSLEGKANHSFRKTLRRVEEAGTSFEVLEGPHDEGLIGACRAISDAWLEAKGAHEMQCSVGYFSPGYLKRSPIAVARGADGRVQAFVNLLPLRKGSELSFDLMRYGSDAPAGVMDFLIINLMRWGREQGFATLNLGMAPLFDVGQQRRSKRVERLAHLLFEHGERIYNYRGLHLFKDKFRPVWEPRYLCYPRPWDWPGAVLAASSLVMARAKEDRARIAAARDG